MTEVCVCTHPREDHREYVMSVPMRGQGHCPPVVTLSSPRATYTRDECHCGCASWLIDYGT